jgi:indole-3-glycerol phosphate synthase
MRDRCRELPPAPDFIGALRASRAVAVIAEVKRASPSKGVLNRGMDAVEQARSFVAGGAASVSVLTEPSEFGGALEDLVRVTASVAVPVLRKDFIVHEGQILEARLAGAAAVLLIVRALEPVRLSSLFGFAREVGLEPLVEVRSAPELERALRIGARAIGVNARNLESLVIDPSLTDELLRVVPTACVAVAESGIAGRTDVERVARQGADAVLVGSSLSIADDPPAAVAALSGVSRVPRDA